MSETWLPTLVTQTPQEGYELAVKLSRVAVKMTQPDGDVRAKIRADYEHDANALIAASSVVAVHFQTIALANNHWKDR
ncbi:peroxidase [Pseudohalocynthiibacter aestuariivivens]|nr:hexameric tyrosine-coordinated heme protein [Pseudohalocynthiibacter aestuariivivens]QIE44922.1 peroxidase [Pseudohalocynthiibacter aestuariivivens]